MTCQLAVCIQNEKNIEKCDTCVQAVIETRVIPREVQESGYKLFRIDICHWVKDDTLTICRSLYIVRHRKIPKPFDFVSESLYKLTWFPQMV